MIILQTILLFFFWTFSLLVSLVLFDKLPILFFIWAFMTWAVWYNNVLNKEKKEKEALWSKLRKIEDKEKILTDIKTFLEI
jgi:hypothetical protein